MQAATATKTALPSLPAIDVRKITPEAMQKDAAPSTTPEAKKKEATKLIVWAVLILAAGFLTAKYTRLGKLF